MSEHYYSEGTIWIETSSGKLITYPCDNGHLHFKENEDVKGKYRIEKKVSSYDAFGPVYHSYAVPINAINQ